MGEFFHTILVQPILNILVLLYDFLPGADIGFAIIALTILIKLLLWPFMQQSLKSQKALQELQPKIEELKQQHKDDREALAKATMSLYQKEKVNPFSSCLPLLVQLPVLIALYQVLLKGFGPDILGDLYAFVPKPEDIQYMFLGLVDLSSPNLVLALLAGGFQFWQTRMLVSKQPPKTVQKSSGALDESMLASMNKSLTLFMPVLTVVFGATLPGGLTLYWVTITVVSILQQTLIFRKK